MADPGLPAGVAHQTIAREETMTRSGFVSGLGATLALVLGSTAASAQQAEDVAAFYRDKQIKMIVTSDVGGGYDTYSRVLARHMGRHIPGNPTIIIQNMPGGGGLSGTNYMYNVAPKDGTVIANIQRGVPFMAIMGREGPRFDPTKFNWLGSLNNEVGVFVSWHTSKIKTLDDVLKNELIVGGSGPNDTEASPAVLNNTIGTKFKIVSGYPSSSAIALAMQRGEVEGFTTSYTALLTRNSDWLEKKQVNILVQNALIKHPDLPHIPLALDYAKTAEDRQVLELMYARQVIGRPFLAPPGVPQERVKALRAAFDATVKDPEFVAEMDKQKLELTPVSGQEVQALIERVAQTPKPIIARLEQYSIDK
jgi:tripartite-type tricarboxylate transporter receptor subunit TctC